METIVLDLEKILQREIMHTTVMGEGTSTVTLGSQLFTTLNNDGVNRGK